ncbi:MAG: hypothetical protein M3Y27_32530, partial [Acidobacteriota bacterium]|nr:hypothetical protein [Acidobacteriota bacterium]
WSRHRPETKRWAASRHERIAAWMLALSFVAHVGDHLREYTLHVFRRWVGDIALAADEMVLGVQVRIVRAEYTLAGETSKGRVQGRHVRSSRGRRAWVGERDSNLVIASKASGRDRVAA